MHALIDMLCLQLYDARLRCALIEAETREEVMVEMEERMRSMEDMFTRRLMRVVGLSTHADEGCVQILSLDGAQRGEDGREAGHDPALAPAQRRQQQPRPALRGRVLGLGRGLRRLGRDRPAAHERARA